MQREYIAYDRLRAYVSLIARPAQYIFATLLTAKNLRVGKELDAIDGWRELDCTSAHLHIRFPLFFPGSCASTVLQASTTHAFSQKDLQREGLRDVKVFD